MPIDVFELDQEAKVKALRAIRRGQALLLNFSKSKGKELSGHHVCVVISSDETNRQVDTLTVVATMTHQGRGPRPYEVPLAAGEADLPNPAGVVPHIIHAIDPAERVQVIFGQVNDETLSEIGAAIRYSMGL